MSKLGGKPELIYAHGSDAPSHRASFAKHNFTDKIIQSSKAMTADH